MIQLDRIIGYAQKLHQNHRWKTPPRPKHPKTQWKFADLHRQRRQKLRQFWEPACDMISLNPKARTENLKKHFFSLFAKQRKYGRSNDSVSWSADFAPVTQFYPKKTDQKPRRLPRAEGGSAWRMVRRDLRIWNAPCK